MTEFETKLLEVLTDIKTELQILTLDPNTEGPNIRAQQRKFNQYAINYKQLDDLYNEEERRLEEFGSEFFKDNPDAEEFVASDAYKRAEARQKRWNEQSSKLDEKMKNLLERGCINTSGFDHS